MPSNGELFLRMRAVVASWPLAAHVYLSLSSSCTGEVHELHTVSWVSVLYGALCRLKQSIWRQKKHEKEKCDMLCRGGQYRFFVASLKQYYKPDSVKKIERSSAVVGVQSWFNTPTINLQYSKPHFAAP